MEGSLDTPFPEGQSKKRKVMMDRRNREEKNGRSSNDRSSSKDSGFQFDVFLSFRGTDTRQDFTSHLYKELNRSGAITFIDSEELRKGEKISCLFQYMESSQIFVPILSENYARSTWCLREAAKMVEIVERDQQNRRSIIPVFYYVDPSHVKDDGGLYQSAVMEHQNNGTLGERDMKDWIDALKAVGRISGFSLKRGTDGNGAELTTRICKRVKELLGTPLFGVQPIGIDSQIDEVINTLEAQADGVCTIGICGMGGIGKTTIAKAIYDKLVNEFDGGSFIEDIREASSRSRKGLPSIQEKLIYNILGNKSVTIDTVERGHNIIKRRLGVRRVLIVLDNVDSLDQLKALLGDQIRHKAKDLFGGGSKIIVTTRDEDVLHRYGIFEHQIYHPQELEYPWSLKLFHRHAFIHEPPFLPLFKLAKEAVGIAGVLPLVLEVFGSVFAGLRAIKHWEGELKKLRKSQPRDIFEKLRWSYDGLDDEQKSVFLDILFFFVGAKRKYAEYLWDEYALENALRVLQERSLICIDDEERFRMHDQIQEMGRQVARQEGNRYHSTNKRLCAKDEALISSMDCQEKRRAEGIVLDMEEECIDSNLSTEVFMDMSKLRLLHLNFVNFQELEINHFPKSLKWLRWRGCVLESVTFDGRSFRNLVILDLSRSNISQLILKNKMDRLKMLDLSHCNRMEATPNFACTPNLEKLFLDDCFVLSEIHGSICRLGNLTTLSMRNCQVVKELPEENQYSIANLFKLMELNLQGCKQLQSLPRLPSSLNKLILQGCKELKAIHGFDNLEYIEILDMDGCEGIDCTIMNKLFQGKSFAHLEELRISGSKTLHECKTFLFVIPLCFSSSPLFLEHLECYGQPGNLDNVLH